MARRNGRLARYLHDAFEIGIYAKATFATAETLSGIALLLIPVAWVPAAARWLTASELGEDPADRISHWIMTLAQGFSVPTRHFWGIYLIGHGLIKIAAVGALILGFRWAYPLSVAVLAGFAFWQMQKWYATGSALMLGLSVFDVVVIWLILQEYRRVRQSA